MSTAELSAYQIYQSYNLSSLTKEVKQCLVALLCGHPVSSMQDAIIEELPKYTVDDLKAQARQNTEDIKNGNCHPIDELFDELGKEYPWAFK